MNDLRMTRGELSRLSAFTLPVEAGARRKVPGLSTRQLRHFDKLGLFDGHRYAWGRVTSKRNPQGAGVDGSDVPLVVRRRQRGEPALYGALDLACARMAAWMIHAGLTYTQVVSVLVGSHGRAVMAPHLVPRTDRALVVFGARGAIYPVAEVPALVTAHPYVASSIFAFPVAWLGVNAGELPRLQRELDHTRVEFPVYMHGRPASIAEIAAYEARDVN